MCNELTDTVELMTSKNYEDRFLAEYFQLKIRHDRLKIMLDEYDTRSLEFDLSCSPSLLKHQLSHMHGYLKVLEYRANIEGIQIN